jgi:plasmid stability protein
MPTLYVENVPNDLYEALRRHAQQNRQSIAAEVISLLEQNVPTREELKARRDFLRHVERLQSRRSTATDTFPSTEELQREDRLR